jgi:LSD1 subclass zinc finger protein
MATPQQTPPPAAAPSGQQGQLRCCGCGVTLAYPLDAPCVRCPMCNAITGVNQVHIRCVRCGVCLALPPTALLARCPRCQQVMQMPRMAQQQQAAGGGGSNPALSNSSFAGNTSNKPVVYIENPPMRDAKGKVHTDTKIGTKLDDVW